MRLIRYQEDITYFFFHTMDVKLKYIFSHQSNLYGKINQPKKCDLNVILSRSKNLSITKKRVKQSFATYCLNYHKILSVK